jgi:ligand-binding sensor domain-containing protein/serine phosphatase RsbU (regulator of sigma subunit)
MHKVMRFCLLVVLCLFLSVAATAQQYNFKNYTPKNGLASSIVNGVFQDSKGYLWFACQGGGVSRFNGRSFHNFTKAEGLIANEVNCVSEDSDGNIWIGTLEGVSVFDGVRFKNYTTANGLKENAVYSILPDKKGKVWLATRGGGVNIFEGGSFSYLGTGQGLPTDIVYSLCRDMKGNIWMGLWNGFACYDGNKITSFHEHPLLARKTVFSTYADSKGNVWLGTTGDGVFRYTGREFIPVALPGAVQHDFIGGITEDRKGNIWFATDHGALKLEKGKFHLFDEKQGLSSNGVLSVATDYEGNIWFGTQGGGVNIFNNESFVNFNEKDGLTSKNISAILQYDADNFIIGTTGSGLNLYNQRTNTFKNSSGLREIDQNMIFTVIKDRSSNIWVGAQDGVYVLERSEDRYKLLRSYTRIDSNELVAALKIIEDKKGNFWIASYGSGLVEIKGDQVRFHTTKNGFPTDNILTVFEDSKGIIWIGTKDAGVVRYDGSGFKVISTAEGLGDKAIWCITEDKSGALYFGTGEQGLYCYDGRKFHNISVKDGLCSNYILALLYDHNSNNLWLGTEKGINKLSFREDFVLASLRYYGEQEGYKGIEVNQNAAMLDSRGAIWFGTVNGLSRYNRQYDFPNNTPPKLQLSAIRLAYQDVNWKDYADSVEPSTGLPVGLRLAHRNNNLSFEFQAFTTDNVRYSFMLEGQDDSWSPLSPNTEAVFTNIDPGKTYTFRVKAVNSNGVWSREQLKFTFTIAPPWWQTWWFYALVVIIVATGIFLFVNYRTAQLAKEKKVLEEKVTERTHELKDANDKLSLAFQDIKDSINYAKKIQDAILPLDEEIRKALPQSFVLFKPRDVVSGDFYWFNKKDDRVYIAAVDCTGHGVPGAFMSMIGNSLLNEIVSSKERQDAATVLKKLHHGVRKSLKQDRNSYESKDGMDLALMIIDNNAGTIQYSGAKRPLFIVRDETLTEVKADKQSIGGLEMQEDYNFSNHDFKIRDGDSYYMFTDGFVDQFGGEHGKKYSTKRFRETLLGIRLMPMNEQGVMLGAMIEEWRMDAEQIDDILVIGLRF